MMIGIKKRIWAVTLRMQIKPMYGDLSIKSMKYGIMGPMEKTIKQSKKIKLKISFLRVFLKICSLFLLIEVMVSFTNIEQP